MSRLPALLVTLALLVPAPAAAVAQTGGGGAFGPLPPAQPAETPPPDPGDAGSSGDVSRQTLALLGLGVVLAFVGIGYAITRDARRSLTESDRAAVDGTRSGREQNPPRKQDMAKIKERQREKARAQRQARKKARKR